jgi:hypothetical protein
MYTFEENESWTNVDWSNWDYLFEEIDVKNKHDNLKTKAVKFIHPKKSRDRFSREFWRELNKKAKKIKIHEEKYIRSLDKELLKHTKWYLTYNRKKDKYFHEDT